MHSYPNVISEKPYFISMKAQIGCLSDSAEIEWQGGIHFPNWTFSCFVNEYALEEIQ